MIKSRDLMAYGKTKYLYEREEYDELVDIAYHYMLSFVRELPDIIMFRDEFENVTGIKEHHQIVSYIMEEL
jgi:hypothetical protein